MAKLMVTIGEENFRLIALEARERGITMQELIRAVIIPDWVRLSNLQRVQQNPSPIAGPAQKRENEIPLFSRSRH